MSGVERLYLHTGVGEGVEDEVGLSADLLTCDEFAARTQRGGEFFESLECGVRAAGGDWFTVLIKQTPDACGGMDVDAKVVHVFLPSG